MANTLINASGYTSGVPLTESGVNIETIELNIEPEFRTPLFNIFGGTRGWSIGPIVLTADLKGEVGGSSGIMTSTFYTATTLTNSTAYFGAPTTGLYPTKATVSLNRAQGAWVTFSLSLRADAGVA